MSQDYLYQPIAKWVGKVPYERHGHALRWNDVRGDEARDLTSPYGALHFACGTGDDFHCFDYAELPDGRIALHAVCNSETGSFIEDASYRIVPRADAPEVARAMVEAAKEWVECDLETPFRLRMRDEPPEVLEHDGEGWNQSWDWFARCVAAYVAGEPTPPRTA